MAGRTERKGDNPPNLSCPIQTSPLLALPLHIRTRILENSGLVRPCPIGLDSESDRILFMRRYHQPYNTTDELCFRENKEFNKSGRAFAYWNVCDIWWGFNDLLSWCKHKPLPISLLSVCKQLCKEATEVLYSENAFGLSSYIYGENDIVLSSYSRVGRRSLLDLNDQAVSAMRRLNIGYIPYNDPVQYTEPVFERFQRPLETVCQSLAERILPGRLRLSLVCSAKDTATQKKILEPLFWLPKLHDLRLYIGKFDDPEVEEISRSIYKAVIMKPIGPEIFPFNRLPLELQERVISHSNLVINQNAVRNFQRRVRVARGIPINSQGRLSDVAIHCCGTCDEKFIWCWCNLAGGGKYSSACSCPRLAVGLFSANKHVAQLALRVFYRENQFYIDGTVDDITQTLSLIPPHRLQCIKRLCLDGRSFLPKYFTEWQTLLTYLHDHARPNLMVKILLPPIYLIANVFGDPNTWDEDFERWFNRLNCDRVSILAPRYVKEDDIKHKEGPFDSLWRHIAGPSTTLGD